MGFLKESQSPTVSAEDSIESAPTEKSTKKTRGAAKQSNKTSGARGGLILSKKKSSKIIRVWLSLENEEELEALETKLNSDRFQSLGYQGVDWSLVLQPAISEAFAGLHRDAESALKEKEAVTAVFPK